MVLVDTSVWVAHLRQGHSHLQHLLIQGRVLCAPFVIGELACGNMANRAEILALLAALPKAEEAAHEEALQFIDLNRLAGKGLGYIDVHLLAATAISRARLWTLDKVLAKEAARLALIYETPGDP